jgi:hypothetical protein
VGVAAMTLATLQQGSKAVHTEVILSLSYDILGSHSSVAEDSNLLECNVSLGE